MWPSKMGLRTEIQSTESPLSYLSRQGEDIFHKIQTFHLLFLIVNSSYTTNCEKYSRLIKMGSFICAVIGKAMRVNAKVDWYSRWTASMSKLLANAH